MKWAKILKVFQNLAEKFVRTTSTTYKQPINKIHKHLVPNVYVKLFGYLLHTDTPLYRICACSAKNVSKFVSLCAPKPVAYNYIIQF